MSGRVESRKKGVTFDFSDLSFAYSVLFALSLVLLNPWGTNGNYGDIWTAPKFKVVIVLSVLSWGVLLGSFVWGKRAPEDRVRVGWAWRAAAGLWLAFLASGAVTVLLSPVTFRSARIANPEMGDGWVYWFCMALFVLGNALLLRRFPELFKAQLYGFLIGGVLSALAVFAQSVNWTLDFTDSSGRIVENFRPLQTESNVFKGFMPIGFTSNRGHVGFILAALAVLVLVCLVRGWLKRRVAWPLYAVFLAGVYLTSTRGVQLAFVVGLLYLLVRFWRVREGRRVMAIAFVPLVLGIALVASGVVGTGQARNLPPLSDIVKNPFKFTSARTNLWPSAVDGIRERPLFGWGFNGYGLAWPHVNDFNVRWRTYLARVPDPTPQRPLKTKPVRVERILRNNHSSFEYLGENGNVYRVRNLTNKAHNIVLDTGVSVGLVGLVLYALLFGFFVVVTARGPGRGLEALAVVYLVFGLTWFESAQYSHLPWWALSVGLALYPVAKASAGAGLKGRVKPRRVIVVPSP